jgi:hypothetical protein
MASNFDQTFESEKSMLDAKFAERLDEQVRGRIWAAVDDILQNGPVHNSELAGNTGLALGYMHPGRVDVIAAGSLVLSRVMIATGATEFVASESDILDGMAWALI